MATLNETLTLWNRAIEAFDASDRESSLELFQTIENPPTVVVYNIGVLLILLDRHQEAYQKLTEAISKDPYLAIAFYRRGCISFLRKTYEEAANDFENCGRLFRSKHINYTQLGLFSTLTLSDVNFNLGVCYFMSGCQAKGMELLLKAKQDAEGKNISTIDKTVTALQQQSRGDFTPILIQLSDMDSLFRPRKLRPEKQIDFLGISKVICCQESTLETNKERSQTKTKSESPENVPSPPCNPPPRSLNPK